MKTKLFYLGIGWAKTIQYIFNSPHQSKLLFKVKRNVFTETFSEFMRKTIECSCFMKLLSTLDKLAQDRTYRTGNGPVA